jgi:hypothetical protein
MVKRVIDIFHNDHAIVKVSFRIAFGTIVIGTAMIFLQVVYFSSF